jgi:hypothetical protein
VSVSTFFQTVKIKRQLGHQMPQVRAFSLQSSGLLAGGIAGRIPTQALLACLHDLFGPRVEVIGFDAFAPAQFVDCDLATKAPPGLYGSSLLRCISCEWLTNLPNEPSGVLAPFFSRLILVLDVLDHVRSFPEA